MTVNVNKRCFRPHNYLQHLTAGLTDHVNQTNLGPLGFHLGRIYTAGLKAQFRFLEYIFFIYLFIFFTSFKSDPYPTSAFTLYTC